MATETKKPEAAAAAAPPIEARCLTLRQKLVEMRKACPEIVKKKHSEGVKYKYAKIYDVWEKITPIMNELGVDFEVIGEKATRYAENGDPVYWITMQTKTYNGDKLMFLYEADLTIRWINLDNDDETLEAVVHALGWNDDPAKAKGAAHTYALKYYLFEKFSIDQGEDDPDNSDFGAQSKGPGGGSGGSRQGQQRQGQGLRTPRDAVDEVGDLLAVLGLAAGVAGEPEAGDRHAARGVSELRVGRQPPLQSCVVIHQP